MSRRPPRCHRAEANSPTLEWSSEGRAMVRSRDNNTVVFDRWPYWRALAAIVALGLVGAVGSLCFFTVDSADYAIVTDFGKPTQVITTPGLGFKHPWQSVRTFDHRLFVYAAPPSEFLTLEKTPVVASGTILWRVWRWPPRPSPRARRWTSDPRQTCRPHRCDGRWAGASARSGR